MSNRPSNRDSRRLQRRNQREASQVGTAPRPQRRRSREAPARQRRGGINLLPIAALLGIAGIAALLVWAVASANDSSSDLPDSIAAELDDSTALPGVYYPPHPGFDGEPNTGDERQHFASGREVPICTQAQIDEDDIANCYHSNPPTSGPHADQPAQFTVWENEAPKENLIHSMEHGAVIVWYNTDDQEVIDKLADIVNEQLDRRRLLVMSRYSGMEPDTIALTSWTRLDKFAVSEFDEQRVRDFIDVHQKRFNPEGF